MDSQKQRRSIRLPDYDYSQPGAYFITICTHQKQPLFGTIADELVTLSRYGIIAQQCWLNLPRLFPQIELDEFVFMPNHMHGVIIINCRGEAFPDRITEESMHIEPSYRVAPGFTNPAGNASPGRVPHGTQSGSVGAIIQNYKSSTTRRINAIRKTPGGILWQRNYYEHIIRNQHSLEEIREYIQANPSVWLRDKYNVEMDL